MVLGTAAGGSGRIASQRWHRDFNDKHLLKAFLYLVDVDEGTGPFQYVPGSAPGGRYEDAWPWRPLGENYPPENELEQRLPAEAFKTFTGPKGSAPLLQHRGLPSRRLRNGEATRACNGDVLLTGVARLVDGEELPLHRLARRARRARRGSR